MTESVYITASKSQFNELHELLKSIESTLNLSHVKSFSDYKKKHKNSELALIFCDQEVDNNKAVNFILRNDLKDQVPVVIISEAPNVKDARKAFKSGAFDFVNRKNLDQNSLEEIIKSARHIRTEMKLRNNLEKRLDSIYANTRAILDNTTDGIWSLDKKGKVLIINTVAKDSIREQGTGCPGVGEPFFEGIHEIFSEVWMPLFKRALKGEQVISVDQYTDNSYSFFLEVACSPIYSGDEVFGVTFITRDVTERERAESKIRESEKNFRSVFTRADVPIMIEAQSDNTIVDLNEACAKLHKYKREEMVGMDIFKTIPPDHIEKSQKNLKLYLNGEIDPLDSFIYTKKNESIPVEISVAQIVYNDIPCNLIFLYDISQRKETEKKLNEARELAEKTAEFKSLFLANMSHEIRTPMNAMIGFTDLLKKTTLNDEQSEYVEIISKSGQDLLVIINDVLDLSKIEAGKLKLRPRAFNLIDIARKVVRLHKNNAKEKNIDLLLEVDSDTPDEVYLDDTRLSQILNNLISNSVKFTQKGYVKIKLNNRFINNHENLQLIIEDTGIGIPEQDLKSIFENFKQVDSSLQRKYSGTGLGLSIVKQLVDLMEGEIEVSSKVKEGSTFEITLPLKEMPDEDQISEIKKRKEIATAELKVLICEDNPVNVKLATKILSDLNISYKVAENGEEGIRLVKSFKPDAILMDLQMPVMDGYEATEEIRKFSNIPIIAMSAHVLENEQKKCESFGMNGFIPKPFKEGEIIEQLRKHFSINPEKQKKPTTDVWSTLNLPRLENLAKGDIEFALSMLELFIENAEKGIHDYNKALIENKEETKKIAHKLLPSFTLFDMVQLQITAEKIESDKATEEDHKYFLNRLKEEIIKISEKFDNLKTHN